VPYGVNTRVQALETPALDPAAHCPAAELELGARHHAVLARRQRRDLSLPLQPICTHVMRERCNVPISPPAAR
jgi:hypothetical protein